MWGAGWESQALEESLPPTAASFHPSCSQLPVMFIDLPTTHLPTLCRPPNSQPAKRGRQRVTLWPVADKVGQGDMQGKRAITCGCTEQPQPISLQGDRLWATLRGSPRVCPGLGGHPNLQLGIEPSSAQEVLTQQRLSGV